MRVFASATIFLLTLTLGAQAGSVTTTNLPAFGFAGPETYPIDNFIANLRSADLNDDGLEDLALSRFGTAARTAATPSMTAPSARWRSVMMQSGPSGCFTR